VLWENHISSRLRAIQVVTFTCVTAFLVKLLINLYQLQLSILAREESALAESGNLAQCRVSDHHEHPLDVSVFPEIWWLLIAVYHLGGEVACSAMVVLMLRSKPGTAPLFAE
jgi:hypothetical protein